ncbi:hypothetical protein Pan216_23920 [Planctomycetes bacterium Pan216]|uniref:DUF3500 domain-containing protein n=1 Tax=Kolteria novifilia TaxID=2527975 RepID=A0A518B3G8_9BACT|nr:hypothetical protein Pan216_23920 [Planctomycetes bacterium Pan216]
MNHDPRQAPVAHDHVSRRTFLQWSAVASASSLLPSLAGAEPSTNSSNVTAEGWVKELHDSLSSDQQKAICFPFDHSLRKKVANNWAIVKTEVADLKPAQREIVDHILRGICSEEGYEKFQKQMEEDSGGLDYYHPAIFGKPGASKFEFVLTGRHNTMRADGNSVEGAAFGGPIFYGHDADGFHEKPHHPGNVFWYQAERANEVFGALDPKQRDKALLGRAPRENDIAFRNANYPGLAVSEMSSDQKDLVKQVMADLLSPYRKQDADEVMELITANGGLDKIHLAYYSQDSQGNNGDIGDDGVWDIWRLEGPGFVWHYRGKPHVHVYVNIADVDKIVAAT